MIGGGAKVRIDVPPFIKADRDPLSFLGLNSVGLIRRGFEKERIDEIHEIYRAIYLRGMNFFTGIGICGKRVQILSRQKLYSGIYKKV